PPGGRVVVHMAWRGAVIQWARGMIAQSRRRGTAAGKLCRPPSILLRVMADFAEELQDMPPHTGERGASDAAAARPNSLEARDRQSVIHGLTDLKAHLERGPLVIDSGRGVWITDTHGKDYIEGMSGLWCISLGYGEKRLIAAATRQMEQLAYYHLTNHRGHARVIELAEKLLSLAPAPMSH